LGYFANSITFQISKIFPKKKDLVPCFKSQADFNFYKTIEFIIEYGYFYLAD